MLRHFRLLVSSCSFLACAVVCHAAGVPQTDSTNPAPAYACVRLSGDGADGPRIRLVSEDERCRGRETRMIIVLSETTPFVADGLRAAPPADAVAPANPLFVSRVLDRFASAPASAPLLVQATLLIDADRGQFGIPPPTTDVNPVVGGRGEPSNVSCVPTLDGRRVGDLTRLLPRGVTLGLPSGVAIDPLTGQVEPQSPGYVPDVFWARLEDSGRVVAGRHEFAVACQGRLGFRFRGTGNLLVLQQAPRR